MNDFAIVEGYTEREIEWKKENKGTCITSIGKTSKYWWRKLKGPIPPHNPPFLICHKCDNHSCRNVEHMFLGTRADNARDWWIKIKGKNIVRGQKTRERLYRKREGI
jgi:hypothetical protein